MRKQQPLDPVIVERYAKGESAIAIAQSLGVVRRTVYNALLRSGVEVRRKLTITTAEQQREMAELYAGGETADAVAERFGVDRMTVYNVLERLGVPTRQTQTILDEEQRAEVARTCAGGVTIDAAAAKFNVSRSTVSDILREQGISLQTGRPRSCEIDDAAFDALTPESLYWMGFLFADGCVHRNRDGQASLVCGLAVKDLGHLEKLRAFCKSTHKIRHYTAKAGSRGGVVVGEREHVYWRVRSNRICDALESRGIVTKRVRVPAPELAASRDFWRGCVDGDGSIDIVEKKHPQIRLCGQPALIDTFRTFLIVNQLADLAPYKTSSGIWQIGTSGKKALAIIETLYLDVPNNAVLERKNTRAQKLLFGPFRIDHFDPY